MRFREYTMDTNDESIKINDDLFERMADFIIELDPDSLSDNQLQEVMDIIDDMEVISNTEDDEDEDIVDEVRLAKRTSAQSRLKAKSYYRKNKSKIKIKKKKFKKSAAGKARARKTKIMGASGRTATGRKKTQYH